jgi:hypothetical protein
MRLYTELGDDFVHIVDARFDGDFDLDAGRGDDEVVIHDTDFDDDVRLYAGRSGWDRLELDACRFEARVWHLGAYGSGPWLRISAWSVGSTW